MPRSKGKKAVTKTGPPSQTVKRFGFNLAKDLKLLSTALNINPWQLGQDKWKEVADNLNEREGFLVTARTTKDRIDLLIKKLKAQELTTKTGTEEEQSQRGELLQNIISLQEEAKELINNEMGASDDDSEFNVFVHEHEIDRQSESGNEDQREEPVAVVSPPEKPRSRIFKNKEERFEADVERDDAFRTMKKDLAPEPTNLRKKRFKMSTEEEFIKTRQDHEISMDILKCNREDEKQKGTFQLEHEKLSLERERIAVEKMKEERLAQESHRSHELAMSQIGFQNTMCELLKGITGALGKQN